MRRTAYLKARYDEDRANGRCTQCRRRPSSEGAARCDVCGAKARARSRARRANQSDRYIPIDEWINATRNRVLRTVRRLDWTTAEEICDLMDIPNGHHNTLGDNAARNKVCLALGRLYRAGILERRKVRALPMEYRVSPRAPRSTFEPPIDLSVCSDAEAA